MRDRDPASALSGRRGAGRRPLRGPGRARAQARRDGHRPLAGVAGDRGSGRVVGWCAPTERWPSDDVPRLHRRRLRHGRQAGDLRSLDARAQGAGHAREGRCARAHLVGGHAAVLQGDLDGRFERVRLRGGGWCAQARHRALPRPRVVGPGRPDRDAHAHVPARQLARRVHGARDPGRLRRDQGRVRLPERVMADDVVLVDVADRVAVITINRPDQRNALNGAVRRALPAAITSCDADDDVDVMILTGADPAFSAGVDLKEFGSGQVAQGESFGGVAESRDEFRGALPPHTKPLIGAVNGVAVTGGFEVALNCDFLIASERARFADTHARVGVMPGWGLTVLLAQRIGIGRAKEMSITGNYIDAPTALAWGLVNHVVAHDDLLPFCRGLAADAVSNDQRGVRRMIQTYNEVTGTTVDEGWKIEARVSRDWEGAGFDPAEIEARRMKVVERGRSQIGR